MIAKIKRGSGFKGTLAYVLGKEGADCLSGTVIGDDPVSMSQAYRLSIPARREVSKPVLHTSLSLPAGESLSRSQWVDVAEKYMTKMGLTLERAYTVVRHSDTAYDHVHIVASRVALDGSLWAGRHDRHRAAEVTTELEKEYGLTVVERKSYVRKSGSLEKDKGAAKGVHSSSPRITETDRKVAERSSGDNSKADSASVRDSGRRKSDERRTAEAPSSDGRSGKSHPGSESREVQESVETLDSVSGNSSISAAVSKSRQRRRRRSSQSTRDIGIRAAAEQELKRRQVAAQAAAEKARQKRKAEAAAEQAREQRAAEAAAEKRRQKAAEQAAAQKTEEEKQRQRREERRREQEQEMEL